jgi:hypothetical protein
MFWFYLFLKGKLKLLKRNHTVVIYYEIYNNNYKKTTT